MSDNLIADGVTVFLAGMFVGWVVANIIFRSISRRSGRFR